MQSSSVFVDDLIDLDETTDLPVIPRKTKRSFGIRSSIGEADETLQILDLANLDVSLDLAPATSSVSCSSSANASSFKNVSTLDKNGKEISCYTNDFSSINELDMAFVGSTLDQSSSVSIDLGESAIEMKSDEATGSKSKVEDTAEKETEAPSVLPINTEDIFDMNHDGQLLECGDLIQLSDSSIDPSGSDSIDEKQKSNQAEAIDVDNALSDFELIKFDDTDELKSAMVRVLVQSVNSEYYETSQECVKENSSNEDGENQQVVSSREDVDGVFDFENHGGEVEDGESEEDGAIDVKLLDITNFVFSSPLPPAGSRNKSLGDNSSLNLMDMSLSKLNCSAKDKEKFSTPKPCLKSTNNTSGGDTSVTNTTNQSRRKSKSVSFQSPGIYFASAKRLSVIRKTPIRRSINRFTGKTLKTPDSVNNRRLAKFSTPNKVISTPTASPFTIMIKKFSKLALATPPSTKINESRPMNEDFSSINLIFSDSCEAEKLENCSLSAKGDSSEQCIRI